MISSPLGESVAVDPALIEAAALDPERQQLLPAAVETLEAPDEVWTFEEGGTTHHPHLRLTTICGREELVVAGTRRVSGRLRLQTWFRATSPLELLRRYRVQGRLVHPVRSFRVTHLASIDAVHLAPDPACEYRAERFAAEALTFAYCRAEGLPSLVGLEIQDATRLLASPAGSLANLLATPCDVAGSRATLARHLASIQSDGGQPCSTSA